MENLSQDWKQSLLEIIKFCTDRGIGLTLVSAPMPDFLLVDAGNYDEYINYVNKLIEGTGVKYYDFNLCREAYIPYDSSLFMDANHLNVYGAEIFTDVSSRFFMGQIPEEELFYDSYQEKYDHFADKIFGVIVQDCREENRVFLNPVTNVRSGRVDYKIIKSADGIEDVAITEKGGKCEMLYSEGEHGMAEFIVYLDGTEASRVKVEYGG